METKITVQGDGTCFLPPDMMSIQFELSVFDSDGKNLKIKKESAFSAFLDSLEKLSFKETPVYVRTEIQKRYRKSGDEPVFVGYRMTDTYHLSLPLDLSLASSFFALTQKNESMELTVSCSFSSSKKEAGRNQAILLAMKSARDKADCLATSLEKKIDSVLDIKVQNQNDAPVYMARFSDVHVEDASFSAQVEAVFLAK